MFKCNGTLSSSCLCLKPKVHRLKSVDNLFVVVEEYDHYQFKESKVSRCRQIFNSVNHYHVNCLKKKMAQYCYYTVMLQLHY